METNILHMPEDSHEDDVPEDFSGIAQWPDGTKFWFENGEIHREDGPAIIWADGSTEWEWRGQLHRVGGPAIEYADGTKQWWKNGLLHREDGPAIERFNDVREWYLNGIDQGSKYRWEEELRFLGLPVAENKPPVPTKIGEFNPARTIVPGYYYVESGAMVGPFATENLAVAKASDRQQEIALGGGTFLAVSEILFVE
jgi:hypothetical protein